MVERRAKIVCTIGPVSLDCLGDLIEAGMDVARLNFSHGTHAEHARVIADLRRLSAQIGRPVAILQDLQGPKIRTGLHADGLVELVAGHSFVITTEEIPGDARRVSTTYEPLVRDVAEGDEILLSDGLLRLVVRGVRDAEVECEVIGGGVLRERAGINLPFGMAQGVDFVALSFVRRAGDIAESQEILKGAEGLIGAVAKLEKPQALEDLDQILAVSDAVMVARGDLGVELSPEQVPSAQERIIRAAIQAGKPVITATQMLESMIKHPWPTRAETSDVANAVLDGTDAVMLSGETAVGQYPVEVVWMMDRIVRQSERDLDFLPEWRLNEGQRPLAFSDAIANSAGRVAVETQAAAIVAFLRNRVSPRS